MEDLIDAEDLLDMLFDKQVNVLSYLPTDLIRNIISYLGELQDILALHYVCTRLLTVMQDDFTWKGLCLCQQFAFVPDECDWKKYFFQCDQLRKTIRKMESHTLKQGRKFYGGNEKWLVQFVDLEDGGTCLEAVTNDVATALPETNYIWGILYYKLSKDTLLVGDRRNINLIDLIDGKIYDHMVTIFNIDVVSYEPHSKQVFAGTDDGSILCWRSSRAKVTVGNMDPRYLTVDRPCITMKGHSSPITALHVSVNCTDANQRLVSGALDGSIIIWIKVYNNGHSYRKEHVLESHPQLFGAHFGSHQNLLITSDYETVRIWDQLSGERLFEIKPDTDPSLNLVKEHNIDFVEESCGRLAIVSGGRVAVWNVKTNECNSSFSLNLAKGETCNGVLLTSCYLFVVTSEVDVHVWNIIHGEHIIKWRVNRELIEGLGLKSARYDLKLIGHGCTEMLIMAPDILHSCYLEFRVSPPHFMGYRKRKREQMRS